MKNTMWMKKTIWAGLLVGAMTVCGVSTAAADYLPQEGGAAEQVESVENVGAYLASSSFVLSRLELRKVSGDIVTDLIEISQTKRFGVQAQSRSLQALALYAREDDRVKGALEDALARFKPGHKLCPTAIIAYGEAFGEEAVEKIAPMAESKHADVRMAVVVAMGRFGGQAGYDKLTELVEAESHDDVRARIESYIQ